MAKRLKSDSGNSELNNESNSGNIVEKRTAGEVDNFVGSSYIDHLPLVDSLGSVKVISVSNSSQIPTGSNLKSIVWHNLLVPIYKDDIIAFSKDSLRIIRWAIEDAYSRDYLMKTLGDVGWMSDLIREATMARNGSIMLGSKISSRLSIMESVKKNGKYSNYKGERALTCILSNYFDKMGLLAGENEWAIIDCVMGDTNIQSISDSITQSMIADAVSYLPYKSIMTEGKTNSFEIANEIASAHQNFVNALIRYDSYQTDLTSFLSRLRSYITDKAYDTYGKEADIFIKNPDFIELSRNLTLIKLALRDTFASSASSPNVWSLEDARIRKSLTDLPEDASIKLMTKDAYARSFDIERIEVANFRETRSIFIEKRYSSDEQFHGFRKVRSGTYDKFIYDSRLEIYKPTLDSISNLDAKKSVISFVNGVVDLEDDRSLITLGCTEDDIENLAAVYATELMVDKESFQICYRVDAAKQKQSGSFKINIIGREGLTADKHIALFINSVNVQSTNSIIHIKDSANFDKRYKYESAGKFIVNPFDEEIEHSVTLSIDKNDVKQVVSAKIKLLESIIGSNIGEYVVSVNRNLLIKYKRFMGLFSIMNGYINRLSNNEVARERGARIFAQNFKEVINSIKSFELIVSNALWSEAKDDKLMATSIYNDYGTQIAIRLLAIKLFLKIFKLGDALIVENQSKLEEYLYEIYDA